MKRILALVTCILIAILSVSCVQERKEKIFNSRSLMTKDDVQYDSASFGLGLQENLNNEDKDF